MKKKIYIAPESTTIELAAKKCLMLDASQILDDGGGGDGTDIGAKSNYDDMEEIDYDMWK